MNVNGWLPLIVGALLLAGASGLGCAWWYRRKLNRLQQRFEKSRFAASQFASQAKKQIGQLQQQLAERPRRDETRTAAGHDAHARVEAQKRVLEASLETTGSSRTLPKDGFADTQPM